MLICFTAYFLFCFFSKYDYFKSVVYVKCYFPSPSFCRSDLFPLHLLKMSLTPAQCEQFWREADKDGDGVLTIQELQKIVTKHCKMSDSQVASMFIDIDKSGDGKISKEEFLDEMLKRPSRADSLMKLFKQYDKNGDGTLSRDEIRQLVVASKLYSNPEKAADAILKACDTDNDGTISFSEFQKVCR